MKPLVNAGSYEILTPKNELLDQLLRIERAGRVCYQSEKGKITGETATKFIKMIMKRGHESVIEHSSLVVRFNNISRGFTHEMVRHRLIGASQESTRYVKPDELNFVFPPHVDINKKHVVKIRHKRNLIQQILEFIGVSDRSHMDREYKLSMVDMADTVESFYASLLDAGFKAEDARQILPIGIKSQIVVSANLREWRHIFKMRTSRFAHWEIRRVMCNLLSDIKRVVPVVFDDFTPHFVNETSSEVHHYELISR